MASGPQEAPNSLIANPSLNILDLLGEGPIQGFVIQSGLYGTDPLTSTFYDNVPVRNLDGSYNFNVSGQGFAVSYTLGTTGQIAMAGFDKVENIIPLSSDTQITNPPVGGGNVKNVTVVFNTSSYPDADSMRVTVRIPALYTVDTNGNTNGFNVAYAINISLNNGPFTQLDAINIQGKCTNPYLYSTTYALPKTTPPASFYQWTVVINKTDQDVDSVSTTNSLYVDSVGVISSSSFNYPNSVLVGTFIQADQFAQIPARSYLMNGLLVNVPSGYTPTQYTSNVTFATQCDMDKGNRNIRMNPQNASQMAGMAIGMPVQGPGLPAGTVIKDYINNTGPVFGFGVNQDPTSAETNVTLTFSTNGITPITPANYPSIWYGDFQSGIWTDNPAWIFYDILTNSRYGMGDLIQTEYVDKWTMYQIAQYCDQLVDNGQGNSGVEPRFSCNINIQQSDDAYNILMNLASVFRGMIYYANGTIYTTQQDDKAPVYGYTNANVIKGQFSYADSARNTRSTVCNVRWNDPTNLYRQNTAYVEDTDGILRYGYVEKNMAAIGCTSPGQAYRLGQWALLAERVLTETISFSVGLEGLYIKPGDVFNVYDNFRNNQNQGGRIVSFDSTRSIITLDRPVTIGSGLQYNFSAIVPSLTLEGVDVTGSDQINLIRNSQMQTLPVTTSFTNTAVTQITVGAPFSTGLFVGSPWILSVTGGGNIFNNASIYQCLATTETQPGIIEVVGLQYNTGLLTLVEQNYNIVPTPPNPGDFSPIDPPSNLNINGVTGMFANSVFYYYLQLSWNPTDSTNLAYYVVSGAQFGGGYQALPSTQTTGAVFNTEATGEQLFRVAAVSKGGVYSSFITGGFLIGANNPMGTPPLSGINITAGYDDSYLSIDGHFTGYLGTTPTFTWTIPQDENGNRQANFIYTSGFLVSLQSYNGATTYYGPVNVNTTSYTIPAGLLYSLGGPGGLRGFNFVVQLIDYFGLVENGATLSVNSPYPRPPAASGFIGFNGGLMYTVDPSQLDFETDKISGVFLWSSDVTGYIPYNTGAGNWSYSSPSLAAIALNGITDAYQTWFSLGDTFGVYGAPIYGPVTLSPNDSISGFLIQLAADLAAAYNTISGSFSQLTGLITQEAIVASGNNAITVTLLQGLSGQITGASVINTALQVQMNTITVNASGVLNTEVNALQASLAASGTTLTALIGTVSTEVVTASGALANQINIVQTEVTGASGVLSARVAVDETALTNSGVALSNLISQVYAAVVYGSGYTTSSVTNVQSALATTGGALSLWLQNISAVTSGQNASINIAAQAFVTGASNGIGGAAVATYGFTLNANGQVVSMNAIATSFPGTFGTIVFGGANLESQNYVAGSAGWFIGYNGFAEFGQGVFRGDFTGAGGNISANGGGVTLTYGNASAGTVKFPILESNAVIQRFQGGSAIHVEIGDYLAGGLWAGAVTVTDNAGDVSVLGGNGLSTSKISTLGGGAVLFPGTFYQTSKTFTFPTIVNSMNFGFDITAGGFLSRPQFGTIMCDVAVVCRYNGASTSTSGAFFIETINGAALTTLGSTATICAFFAQ